MKTRHDGDCSIYASLSNIGMPEAGICTCGYGHQLMKQGNYSEMYSKELSEKLEVERGGDLEELARTIEKMFGEKG